jgi:hypothetical protein
MRNVTVFETAEEFIRHCNPHRAKDDKRPIVNKSDVTLVIDNGELMLQDEKQRFELDPAITEEQLIQAMADALYINLHQS